MLINLHVKNLALIDETEVDFKEGLNILTGETGAGKSIIIGSISAALGGKVSRDSIRSHAEYALVELVFEINQKIQREKLEAMNLSLEDNQLIISRKITNGRSVSKVNGETVPASLLKKIAEVVIDIHGQHEHQSLLNRQKHLEILDEFAKQELEEPKQKLADVYHRYLTLCRELETMNMDESARERELSFLQYEIDEIEQAQLQEGEDEQLEENYRKLVNMGKITQSLSLVSQLLEEQSQGAASELVGNSVRELAGVASLDQKLAELYQQLSEIEGLLGDFNREVSDYLSQTEMEPSSFQNIEQRLDLLNHLKAKYGKTIEEIFVYQKEKQDEYEQLLHQEEIRKKKQKEQLQLEHEMTQLSVVITEIRKRYSLELVEQIKGALQDMNFLDVQFAMQFQQKQSFSADGMDEAEFLISTNIGEPLRSLGKVASGGELSRIMLAIKTVLAQKDHVDTMIFDEIDVGISGRTAQKIAEKMGILAGSRQIICITHLPQIAAMADTHFLIEKQVNGQETTTRIHDLDDAQMKKELARLLGGARITDAVLENAGEMKALASQMKRAHALNPELSQVLPTSN